MFGAVERGGDLPLRVTLRLSADEIEDALAGTKCVRGVDAIVDRGVTEIDWSRATCALPRVSARSVLNGVGRSADSSSDQTRAT